MIRKKFNKDDDNYKTVRQKAVDYEEKHPDDFKDAIKGLGFKFEDHIKRIRGGDWGDDPEISAIHKVYDMKIVIHREGAGPQSIGGHGTKCEEGERCIEVAYISGLHYDEVVDIPVHRHHPSEHHHKAATKIQSAFRVFRERKKIKESQHEKAAALHSSAEHEVNAELPKRHKKAAQDHKKVIKKDHKTNAKNDKTKAKIKQKDANGQHHPNAQHHKKVILDNSKPPPQHPRRSKVHKVQPRSNELKARLPPTNKAKDHRHHNRREARSDGIKRTWALCVGVELFILAFFI